ncbi:hypothetical protein P154DRAFT_624650 [Amniculicola lignicola CBS 123094]|uniref:Rhodopsin domain-containing protein n=1 Tax=Amniculicola lignicola CBS 123094 TaxID=1392246 RepID=A0A6A5W055_9PLEO|nr:hypothetical protein P154DRAFT_624650 [Amniculicola lignicola CBS 123094]
MTNSMKAVAAFGTSRAKVILGVVITFTITSTISLVLRFVGKRIKKTKISSEDWSVVAAQVAVYGLAVATFLEVTLGNAGHQASDNPSKVPQALKILIAVQCLYAAALGLIKVSICLFYNRIFPFRSFHVASWCMVGIIIAWACAAVLYALLSCQPLAMFWNPRIRGGYCVPDQVTAWVVIGAIDVVIDIIMLGLPLPLLWNLNVSLPDKIALTCIFGAGISTMVFSVLRVEALVGIDFDNITYTGANALVWTFVEPAVGISVACAPFLRPIFRQVFPGLDIEMGPPAPKFFQLQSSSTDSLPSFVNTNIHEIGAMLLRQAEVMAQFLDAGTNNGSTHAPPQRRRASNQDHQILIGGLRS